MVSKKRFLGKRMIDDSLGRALFVILRNRKRKKLSTDIKKIIIFKLSALGDSLLTLPAIKDLKEKTGAEIVLVHSKENEAVFRNQDFIDKKISLNVSGFNPFDLLKGLFIFKKQNADIAIDLSHTGNLSGVFSFLSGDFSVGFLNQEFPLRRGFYDKEFFLDNNNHMINNYFRVFSEIGKSRAKQEIKLIPPKRYSKVKTKLTNLLKKKSLVGIHPCHEIKEKSWPKENFAKIIDYLIRKGKTPVIFGSPKEKPEVKKLISLVKGKDKIINLSGKLTLEEIFGAMNFLDFFVSNDGGLMHIAASYGLPTLGIFCAESPLRYAPYNKKSFAIDTRKVSNEDSLKTAKKVIDTFLNKHL